LRYGLIATATLIHAAQGKPIFNSKQIQNEMIK
jgi:hypothetical protein